jgi:hypothetical protein
MEIALEPPVDVIREALRASPRGGGSNIPGGFVCVIRSQS